MTFSLQDTLLPWRWSSTNIFQLLILTTYMKSSPSCKLVVANPVNTFPVFYGTHAHYSSSCSGSRVSLCNLLVSCCAEMLASHSTFSAHHVIRKWTAEQVGNTSLHGNNLRKTGETPPVHRIGKCHPHITEMSRNKTGSIHFWERNCSKLVNKWHIRK